MFVTHVGHRAERASTGRFPRIFALSGRVIHFHFWLRLLLLEQVRVLGRILQFFERFDKAQEVLRFMAPTVNDWQSILIVVLSLIT